MAEDVDTYERDLLARDGRPENAQYHRFHPSSATMGKPVSMLTAKEVRAIRDRLLDKGLTRASVNRFNEGVCGLPHLGCEPGPRVANRAAWKLKALPDAITARNIILTDAQVRDAVSACYVAGGDRLGIYMETLATTGTRPIQARRLTIGALAPY